MKGSSCLASVHVKVPSKVTTKAKMRFLQRWTRSNGRYCFEGQGRCSHAAKAAKMQNGTQTSSFHAARVVFLVFFFTVHALRLPLLRSHIWFPPCRIVDGTEDAGGTESLLPFPGFSCHRGCHDNDPTSASASTTGASHCAIHLVHGRVKMRTCLWPV